MFYQDLKPDSSIKLLENSRKTLLPFESLCASCMKSFSEIVMKIDIFDYAAME